MAAAAAAAAVTLTSMTVHDLRFPTSLEGDGSDAVHPSPDYSAVYVQLGTDDKKSGLVGCGLTFTCGRGNELVKMAVDALRFHVVNKNVKEIQDDMVTWIDSMVQDGQMRWLGPDKGALNLAVSAITNAFWDLWAKREGKPVWQLLLDMGPEKTVGLINFKYISDYLSKDEALKILQAGKEKEKFNENKAYVEKHGIQAYTTQIGWLGYEEDKLKRLAQEFKAKGFMAFKAKVGKKTVEEDSRRLEIIRKVIGQNRKLMVDANQKWSVDEAIDRMSKLLEHNLNWIEEPTSPDDVIGHGKIKKELEALDTKKKPAGISKIGVATGEVCQNRVMFKQFLQQKALSFCQIDSARMASLNDVLAVYLMAVKAKVPVCPHAGGVGLSEMVQHLQTWYMCALGPEEKKDCMVEYVSHQFKFFVDPPKIRVRQVKIGGRTYKRGISYKPPEAAGYSTTFKDGVIQKFAYPEGEAWQALFLGQKYDHGFSVDLKSLEEFWEDPVLREGDEEGTGGEEEEAGQPEAPKESSSLEPTKAYTDESLKKKSYLLRLKTQVEMNQYNYWQLS